MVSAMESVLTLDEAAEMLKVSPEAVEKYLSDGEMAGRQLEGEWRTTSRAVMEFVDGLSSQMTCCTTEDGKTVCCTPSPSGSGGCC